MKTFRPRLIDIAWVLTVVGLTVFTLWGVEPAQIWAAPGQHPNQQTVPPRPTPTPTLMPTPAGGAPVAPTPAPTVEPDRNDDESGPEPRPTETAPESGETGSTAEAEPVLTEPAGSEPPAAAPDSFEENAAIEAPEGQPSRPTNSGGAAPLEQADLSLALEVSNRTPRLGELITFTLTISNSGPGTALNIVVGDTSNEALRPVNIDSQMGSYYPEEGLWRIDSLSAGQEVVHTLGGQVLAAGSLRKGAEILAASLPDPDSTPANNVPAEDDQVNISLTVADVAVVSNSEGAAPAPAENGTPLDPLAGGASGTSSAPFNFSGFSLLASLVLGLTLTISGVILVRRA